MKKLGQIGALTLLVCALGLTPPAFSDVILPPHMAMFPGGMVPDSESVTIPKFDGSLGTLTKVSIDLGSSGVVLVEIDDADMSGGSLSAFIMGGFEVLGIMEPDPGVSGPIDLSGGTGFDPGFMGPLDVFVSGGGGLELTAPGDVAFFSGAPGDMFDIFVELDSFFESPDPDSLGAIEAMYDGGGVAVTYEFMPIPEPGSAIGLALIPFLFSQRKRTR